MLRKIYVSDYSEVDSLSQDEQEILEIVFKKIQQKIDNGSISIMGSSKYNNSTHEKIFDIVNGKLYTQGIIGVVKTSINNHLGEIEEIVIVIKSRFDKNIDKPYFLAKMLKSANLDISDELSEASYDDLFDFLIVGLFKSKFIEAYQKGLFKKYITNYQTSFKPKGSIVFSDYIKNLSSRNQEIPYKFAERSINNSINKLILMAYDSLKRYFPSQVEKLIDSSPVKNNLDILRSELPYFIANNKKILSQTNRPISHPFFSSYEDLRQLCLSILKFESLSPFDQEIGETEAILYYIPDLWEEYLENSLFLQSSFKEFKVEVQSTLKILNLINIRPDFLVKKNGIPFAILDAKFKPKWSEGVILEDYSKCIRDMNSFNTQITGVIYPTNLNVSQTIIKYKISQFNQRDIFIRIPVNIPEIRNQKFHEFSLQMDKSIDSISKELYYQFSNFIYS